MIIAAGVIGNRICALLYSLNSTNQTDQFGMNINVGGERLVLLVIEEVHKPVPRIRLTTPHPHHTPPLQFLLGRQTLVQRTALLTETLLEGADELGELQRLLAELRVHQQHDSDSAHLHVMVCRDMYVIAHEAEWGARRFSRLLRDISLHLQIIPLHHRNISRLLGIHLQRQIGHVLIQLHLTPTQHPNRVRQEQVVVAVAGMNVYPSPHNYSTTLINPHEFANDDLTLHRKVRPNLPHTQHTSHTKKSL